MPARNKALLLTALLLGCKDDPAKSPDRPATTEHADTSRDFETTGDERPSTPAAESIALIPSHAPISPEGCVRLDGAWRCVLPDTTPPPAEVVDIVTFENQRCELYESGRLRCEGDDEDFEYEDDTFEYEGVETFGMSLHELSLSRKASPRQVRSSFPAHRSDLSEIADRDDVIAIGAGWGRCLLTRDAELHCWNKRFDAVQTFADGLNHACRVSSGKLTCWSEFAGVLDHDDTLERDYPMLPPVARVSIVPGYQCVLTEVGTVWCWGGNRNGELGQEAELYHSHEPLEVPGLARVVSMRNFKRHSCALLESGDLRCWGDVAGRLGAATKIPEPESDGCVTGSLESWATLLRASTDPVKVKTLLRRAGLLVDVGYLAGSRNPGATLELTVRVSPSEMNGRPPVEALVEVRIRILAQNERVLAAVYVEDEQGRHCPVGADKLSAGLQPAHESLPNEPGFSDPVELELVELLAAGRHAISRRVGIGSEGSDPSASTYSHSYFILEDRALVEVFGPQVLYQTMTSTFVDDPTITGSVELGAEFPRSIVTHETTDCQPLRDSCQRNPEACATLDTSCTDGTVSKTWRYVDGRYQTER